MTQTAIVRSLKPGNIAEITLKRESACGKSCARCAGCFTEGRFVSVDAFNSAHAGVGDTVVVESSSRRVIGIAALVYLTPVFAFFAAYFCLALFNAPMKPAFAGGFFFLGFAAPVFYSRRVGARKDAGFYTITGIVGIQG